ncbi:MAG: extracellular solute-binding protein [Chloroflexota bacterium]
MHRFLALAALSVLVVGACASTTSPSPSGSGAAAPTTATPTTAASPSAAASEAAASPTALAPDPAEAVIPNVEANAEIGFWTFYLSPTFDGYIKDTIARFEATYPGVKVKWQDHQATFQADLNNAFAANIAPDVVNLSVSEGWVSDYASRGQLLGLNSTVPKAVQDIYFPGLWNEQLVKGENFQFPWYQGLNVELINKRIYDKTGLTLDQFPRKVSDLPALCKTIKDKTGTLCDIRLTVNDLLSQMVYEGNVNVINDAGTAFTFDSKAGVVWLQMYVDMVRAGIVDNTVLTSKDDRVGLLLFSAGQAAFYATSPNHVGEVKSNNATLYGDLAMEPAPVGLSGVLGKGLMSISVSKATTFPNASIALAQFFTNPRSMLQFARQVAVYPSSPSAYDDPFFSDVPTAVEDSARPLAKGAVGTYQDIVPTIPKKADVNQVVLKAIESALFDKVPAQKALTDAVAAANKLIQ